ncbi:tape measure domain-containing protein [Chryseobacterium carnipullorum]|uniref:tape measure protein n=1 Tax=Chryseobacterium carnipullorum TaxID=1124835 RepID=UPI00090F9B25|nr:tape measure protein [Chryseobacterium carnipullorum]SHL52505.1 tape measure domain-containing protein [Chryseobacterium carnipullorum]
MNTSQGALHFGASIDTTQFRRDIDSMRRDILGLTQTTVQQTGQMDSAFKNLSIGIASYFSIGAIKSFVTELINVRGEFQKTEIAFSTMLGNAGDAKALMGQMVDLAAKTPFSLQDVSSGAKQLLAFQVPANEVVDTLTRMGNIAAGLSIPLSRINLVYGQVKAKGKLMGDDLRQFTEAGIPMVAELAKKFNKTTAEISAMVSAGKIGFKDVKDVLFSMTNEGGMFFNLMEKQSQSLSGLISNLGDTWDQMLNKIGQSQEGALADGIKGLAYLIEHYQEVGKALLTLVEIYGSYKAALILTSVLQTRVATPAVIQGFANLIKIIQGTTVAQEALNAASLRNPYVLLATVIAALIAVTYNYRKEIGMLLGVVEEATTAQKVQDQVMQQYNENFSQGVIETRAAIQQLIYVIKSEYSSLQQREQAYKKLIDLDSTFVGTLDNQFKATERLSYAFENLIRNMQKMAMAQAEVAVRAEKMKKFAEAEMNVGITEVKLDDAVQQVKALTKQYKEGKITKDQYFKGLDKTNASELNVSLLEQKKSLVDIKKEKEFIQKLDQKEISNLLKGNEILKAQIRGGKVKGKILTPEGKKDLEAQLKNNENILKVRFSVEPEIKVDPAAVKSWAQGIKDQISALEEELNAPGTSQARYYAIQDKIDQLNELLNPKKEKKAKKDNRQLAEIIPLGSLKELERRARLYQDALESVENGLVKLRKLDKYGNDKDKKGNPYLTGEVISVEELKNRMRANKAQVDALRKELSISSFDEEMQETERQWKVRYKMAAYYGEESAKAMFPKLKGESYYSDINERFKALNGKKTSGVDMTDEELDNWGKLKDILSSLNGTKDPFTSFTESLEKDLIKFDKASDKIEYLNKKLYKLTDEEISKGYKAEIFTQLNNINKDMEQSYDGLLKEHKSYADRRVQIEYDATEAIKKINSDQKLTPEQQKTYSNSISKKSKEEISQNAVEELTQSKAWMSLYGNIDELTAYQMQALLKELEAKKDNLSKVLIPIDFGVLLRNFRDVKAKISDENPFLGLFNSLQDLFASFGAQSQQAGEQAFAGFEKATEGIRGTLKAAKGVISTLTPAREYMSDTANDAIDTIDQVATMGMAMLQAIDGTVKAVKKALDKASWSNWITAIISIIYTVIKAIVSLFSWIAGNKTKKINRDIKNWQRVVDELKNSYQELQKVIEKTAGEEQLSRQRELITNLQEQQRILSTMRSKEGQKKKADQDKIARYSQEINEINQQIQQIVDDFQLSVTTVDFKDLSKQLAEALVNAFGQGEDAAKSFDKVWDDVMRNAVSNALRIKILEPKIQEMVDKLYSSMGYGGGGSQAQKDAVKSFEAQIAEIDKRLQSSNGLSSLTLNSIRSGLVEKLKQIQAQISANSMSGAFDGLTKEEREAIKAMGTNAMQQYMDALKQYEELFGASAENAQGLKGDIKGITEKTAGALEGQFNAVRINIAAVLKIMQGNQTVSNAQTALLSQIEINTRRLHNMDKTLSEMNSKIKPGLAGIP